MKLAPLRWLGIANVFVARPRPQRVRPEPVVSVVVAAARNEAGNIPQIFDRVPSMGAGTELIFVEGGSSDDTWGAIEREIARRPGVNAKLYKQPGKGKGDAVRVGFREASGDLLMILDADLTVPPEDLPRFYEAWASGKAEFVNGVRLVYPMEDRAMRFFNSVGNKFFSLAFTWLLSQSIKDTLCGTKVLSKRDYETIATNRGLFRRNRSVRGFRPAVRRGQVQSEDRGSAGALRRADLRRDQYPALEPRPAAAAHGGQSHAQDQVCIER